MRLTGGQGKGRVLKAPPSFVRPTSARTREILFQVLHLELAGARVLDLFAGSGLLGLESLARGAQRAVFVEKQGKAIAVIKHNIELCGFGDRAKVVRHDALKWLDKQSEEGHQFDLILADPPYALQVLDHLLAGIVTSSLLRDGGKVVLEASSREPFTIPPGWRLKQEKELGDTRLLFLTLENGA